MLAAAVPAVHSGSLDGVLLGMLALLTLAVFEGVRALPAAAEQFVATHEANRRLVDLTAVAPAVTDPTCAARARRRAGAAGRGRPRPLRAGRAVGARRRRPDARARPAGRAARPERRGQDDARASARSLPGPGGRARHARRPRPARVRAGRRAPHRRARGPGRASLRDDDPRERAARPSGGGRRRHRRGAPARARAGSGSSRFPTASTRRSETKARSSPAESVSGSRSRARSSSGAPLLVLDEPTAHLDDETAAALLDDLLDAVDDAGVLLITHSPLRLERFDTVLELGGRPRSRARPAMRRAARPPALPGAGPAHVFAASSPQRRRRRS